MHALPISACPFDVQLALRMAAAQQGLEAGLVDASDFDEARAGPSPEHVWAQLQALLPLSPDLVFTHGDYSLDKVLLYAARQVTGFIDLGRLGVAARYQDLAICWNCLAEFGELAQRAFMQAYGIAEPDERKLAAHLCLDEFF